MEETDLGFLTKSFFILEDDDSRKSSLYESEISIGDEEREELLRRLLEQRRDFAGDFVLEIEKERTDENEGE
ncbi:hypothetical protein HAX54_040088, partial [Datura stramonium]|nr:hypothetical protein [Datura stramonium]